MSKLSKRVWENHQLTLNTKHKVYQASVLSTLLYGSESWTTYPRQENRLESFHLRCLRRMMGIRWQDSHLHSCSGEGRRALDAPHALSASTTVAGTRAPYGGRSHPSCLGMPPCGQPSSQLQGCLQAGPETDGHQPRQLRKARRLHG